MSATATRYRPDVFGLSEEMSDQLHLQDGLTRALIQRIADLHLPADEEHVLLALIQAQDHCRAQAQAVATRLLRPA